MELTLKNREFLRDLNLSFYEVPDSKYFLLSLPTFRKWLRVDRLRREICREALKRF